MPFFKLRILMRAGAKNKKSFFIFPCCESGGCHFDDADEEEKLWTKV